MKAKFLYRRLFVKILVLSHSFHFISFIHFSLTSRPVYTLDPTFSGRILVHGFCYFSTFQSFAFSYYCFIWFPARLSLSLSLLFIYLFIYFVARSRFCFRGYILFTLKVIDCVSFTFSFLYLFFSLYSLSSHSHSFSYFSFTLSLLSLSASLGPQKPISFSAF